jgi:hypothetical protein
MIVHVLDGSIALDKLGHHCYFLLTNSRGLLDQFEMNKEEEQYVSKTQTNQCSNLVTPRYIEVLCPNVSMDFLGTASIAPLLGESMAPLARLFSDDVLSEAAAPLVPPATTMGRCWEPVLIDSARLCELPAATVPFLPSESERPKLLALASVLISSGCGAAWCGAGGCGWGT